MLSPSQRHLILPYEQLRLVHQGGRLERLPRSLAGQPPQLVMNEQEQFPGGGRGAAVDG